MQADSGLKYADCVLLYYVMAFGPNIGNESTSECFSNFILLFPVEPPILDKLIEKATKRFRDDHSEADDSVWCKKQEIVMIVSKNL